MLSRTDRWSEPVSHGLELLDIERAVEKPICISSQGKHNPTSAKATRSAHRSKGGCFSIPIDLSSAEWPFCRSLNILPQGTTTSKIRRKTRKSHTWRNIAILILVVVVGVGATLLSGALSPPQAPASYVMLVHVYDSAYGTPETINSSALVNGVILDVTGPRSLTVTVNGVLLPEQVGTFPEGTYQIRASKDGYVSPVVTYVVGPNCERRDLLGACHSWIAMSNSTQ